MVLFGSLIKTSQVGECILFLLQKQSYSAASYFYHQEHFTIVWRQNALDQSKCGHLNIGLFRKATIFHVAQVFIVFEDFRKGEERKSVAAGQSRNTQIQGFLKNDFKKKVRKPPILVKNCWTELLLQCVRQKWHLVRNPFSLWGQNCTYAVSHSHHSCTLPVEMKINDICADFQKNKNSLTFKWIFKWREKWY